MFPESRQKNTKERRILCLGDSNTWGYDPRSYIGSRYPSDVRWTGLLEYAGWTVMNCGRNGMLIPQKEDFGTVKRLIHSRLPLNVITVMLGSNDLLEGAGAEETTERMECFLPCVTETAPDAEVLLIAPPSMKEGEWVQSPRLIKESAELAKHYRKAAARREVEFADAESWGIELTYDGVHFSPEGHMVFAERLMELL